MSEAESLDLRHVEPGEIIEIGGGAVLNQFENDLVATRLPTTYVDPLERWKNREKLTDALRPKGFNGRLDNIVAVLLDRPYEQLIEKWPSISHTTHEEWARVHTIGFLVLGDMVSSGRGVIGNLESRVWIYRRPFSRRNHNSIRYALGDYNRKVDPPRKGEYSSVEAVLEESKQIGQQVLSLAMRHAYCSPIGTSRRH